MSLQGIAFLAETLDTPRSSRPARQIAPFMIPIALSVLSILFQLGATYLALRLTRLTQRSWGWLLVSLSMFLMAFHGIFTLMELIVGGRSTAYEWSGRLGFAISILMLAGMQGMKIYLKQSETDAHYRKAMEDKASIEETLRNTLVLNQTLVESNPGGILLYNGTSGDCVLANRAAEQIIQAPPDALRKQNFRHLDSWRSSGLLESAERVLVTRTEETHQTHMFTSFGREVWLECHLSTIDIGQVPHLLLLFHDGTERVKAEEALRESQEYTRVLFADSHIPLVVMDAETGSYLDCNQAAVKIYGYGSREEVLGKTPLDVSAPIQYDGKDSPTAAQEHIQACRETGSAFFEWRHQRPNGEIWDAEVHLMLFWHRGQTLMQFSLQDITERKQTEEAMRQDEVRLKALMSLHERSREQEQDLMAYAIEEGLKLSDSQVAYLHFVSPDEKTIQLVSWSKETLPNNTTNKNDRYTIEQAGVWADCIRQRKPVIHNNYANLPEQQGLPEGPLPIQRYLSVPIFDGEHIVAIAGVGNKAEDYTDRDALQLRMFMGGFWNLIRRKRAEEALRASEQRFRMLVENQGEGVGIANIEEIFTFANPAAERIFGVPAGTLVGRNLMDFLPPTRVDFVLKETQKRLQGESSSYELDIIRSDGERRNLEITGTPLLGPDQQFLGTLGVFRDVTERKLAQKELERLMSELDHKNKELETLVYVASHDLRSPLVNVMGFSQRIEKSLAELERLLDEGRSLEALREFADPLVKNRIPASLGHIKASGAKMDTIINGLLRLSRAGRITLRPERLDMDLLFAAVLSSTAFQLQSAGATVEYEFFPHCLGDAVQVSQIFANLVDNAIKYRDPSRPLRVRISGSIEKGQSVYCVEDNGLGIATEHVDRIFDLFQRLDPKGPIAGDGLGLTLVKRMVERNGGEIRVESQLNKGSRFFVALPAA